LVVDDIATNLKVAEGLLAPYRAAVDTCLNGLQSVKKVKQHHYDLVLMDHMMPEMDGIEAAAAIRAWEKEQQKKDPCRRQIPIIALTANAVVGMREMFLENGLNDFLAKPIDFNRLDEILDRWVPKEERENMTDNKEQNQVFTIPGVDMEKGIAMTGGSMEGYFTVLSIFCKDTEDRLPLLQTASTALPTADTLSEFVTQVHALKSASASIGAADVSVRAAGLETAGKAGDMAFIQENLPVFIERLAELAGGIRAWEKAREGQSPEKPAGAGGGHETLMPLLHELADALKLQKANDIERILEQLMQQAFDSNVNAALGQISDEVLMVEYDRAGEILETLLKKMNACENMSI
jgi:CheY-like chemotaxis protein